MYHNITFNKKIIRLIIKIIILTIILKCILYNILYISIDNITIASLVSFFPSIIQMRI